MWRHECPNSKWESGLGEAGGAAIVEEGSAAGAGLHVLLMGEVHLVCRDLLTSQRVALARLRDVGDIFGNVTSSAPSRISAHAGRLGATTLFVEQDVALYFLLRAGKRKAYAAMEEFRMARLSNVRAEYAEKTLLMHRSLERLDEFRTQTSLLFDLERMFAHDEMLLGRCIVASVTPRDVSRLLGPIMRLRTDVHEAIAITGNALLPSPTTHEFQVLSSWVSLLHTLGACTANMHPALQALSCLRLSPMVSSAMAAAQMASSCSLALVDVLPKPVSFVVPLVRSMQALLAICMRGGTRPDGLEEQQGCQSAEVGRHELSYAHRLAHACSPTSMNSVEEESSIDVERALSRAQLTAGHLNTLHKVQGVVYLAKDVAASVKRSRVLAKNTMIHRHVDGTVASESHLPRTLVKEHRQLVKRGDMMRVLTTDTCVEFFVSEKAGSAAGIVDEYPVTLSLFNDSVVVTPPPTPVYMSRGQRFSRRLQL